MGTHENNWIIKPFRKLVRGRKKPMSTAEVQHWKTELEARLADRIGVALHPLQSDPSMVPPARIVKQIQGRTKSQVNTFLGTGYRDMVLCLDALHENGFHLPSLDRMLDLGFGAGRLLLQFLPMAIERHGCDANPRAVAWTSEKLGSYAELRQTTTAPALPYEAAFFDLVLAFSVFTHIPFAVLPAWIEELGRVIRPGGFALITIHDFARVPPEAAEHGWYEKGRGRGLHINTFLTREKLEALWSGPFEVLDIRHQHTKQPHVVLRRRAEVVQAAS